MILSPLFARLLEATGAKRPPASPRMPMKPRTPMPKGPMMPKSPCGAFALFAIVLLVLGGALSQGCFPGADPKAPIETSSGTRPAGVVWAQDAVGDVLDALSQAQLAAVRLHQSPPPEQRDPRRREQLIATQAGIRAGYDALIAWKKLPSGGGPDEVIAALKPVAGDLLSVATSSGVLTPAQAELVRRFLTPIMGGAP